MKRIRRSRAARMVSWLLTLAMITPLVTGVIAPVSAQTPTAAVGGVQTAIVLDFTSNEGGPLGKLLATQARDAVVVELMNSGRFDPLKQEDVVRTANELGLKPPFDQVARMHLAQQLGATVIVDGKVEFVKDLPNRQGVQVGLTIRITEAQTGDLISGAAQIGESRSRPGITDRDSLAQEAVGNAATLGVRQILTYNLPEGTVIGQIGGGETPITILVNKGARDGVADGMEMIVTRGRERVGRIKITRTFNTDSEARVLDNTLGIKPEDKVKAVFPMPIFDVRGGTIKSNRPRQSSGNALSTLGKVLLVVGVGLLIATAAKGNSTVTGVIAEPTTQNFGPAVRIVWKDNLFGQNAIEYHIWRSPDSPFNYTGIPVGVVSGGALRQFIDLPAPFTIWNGVRQFIQPGFPQTGGNNNNNGGGGGNTNRTLVTPAATVISGFPIVGQTYIYSVSAVVEQILNNSQQNNNGGGGNNNNNQNQLTTQDVESTPVPSGPATPIFMPVINPGGTPQDQAANVDLRAASFTFPSLVGADEYQVQISLDPTFTNRNAILIIGPIFGNQQAAGVPQTAGPIDLFNNPVLKKNPVFANFVNQVPGAPTPVIFWRVGARNSQDRPGPVHAISQRPTDTDRTFRFIYSLANRFTPAPLPPPPP